MIPDSELVERFSRSPGPGGQSVNTTDSRVELEWDASTSAVLTDAQQTRLLSRLPSPVIRIVATEHRSQHRNRGAARERLADQVRDGARAATPSAPADEADPGLEGAPPRGQEAARSDQVAARPGPGLEDACSQHVRVAGGVPRWETEVARTDLLPSDVLDLGEPQPAEPLVELDGVEAVLERLADVSDVCGQLRAGHAVGLVRLVDRVDVVEDDLAARDLGDRPQRRRPPPRS